MKKLLILGAGETQLHLLQAAKELGYFTVVFDMRPEMEAAQKADKYYQINYMDRDAILAAARAEKIDGVISNSEPAMLNVAWLSQQLGLPGNTEESVDTLLSKEKFRELQKRVGAYSPAHFVVRSPEELLQKILEIDCPFIVKPTESSGTRGTTRFDSRDEEKLRRAYQTCRDFSRNGLVTVEEYVAMPSLRIIGMEIFVLGDEIFWDGWYWQDRSKDAPMLPRAEIYPLALPAEKKREIRSTVEKIIRGSGVRLGEYNVETYYTTDGKVFVIEINPRQAGNHIPQLIEQHTGVNLTRLLVSTAVGDMSYYEYLKTYQRQNNYAALQVVFSKSDGIFEKLYIAPELRPYVKWIEQTARPGEKIVKGVNASEAVAYVDMQFDSYETQHRFTDDIEKYIYPILKEGPL